VQRRRRKKAAPKNIFGSGSQTIPKSKPTSSPKPNPTRNRSQIAPPPSVPGAKPKPKQTKPIKTETQPVDTTPETQEKPTMEDELSAVDDLTVEETPLDENQETIVQEKEEVDILEEQILGIGSRKDIGLKKELTQTSESKADDENQGKSQKARQIIQDSMIKASIAVEEAKTLKQKQAATPIKKDPPKKPQRKFRNKTSSYQPANRARRLDRSRHMEYKYEMRGLLSDIGIAEEHRSNLLATIWARGERQTTNEAKEFLSEKLNEGIIDEDQMSSLEKIVDGYTVRR
jgi:hypothetical protein